eukprot:1928346-Pyramimonas_sp.AAC.1
MRICFLPPGGPDPGGREPPHRARRGGPLGGPEGAPRRFQQEFGEPVGDAVRERRGGHWCARGAAVARARARDTQAP